jgi:lysozyme
MAMKASREGIELIKRFEGLRLHAYLCPANVPTIGYGHTKTAAMGQKITEEQAEALLIRDLVGAENDVTRLAGALKQCQFDALVSFVFNLGAGNFKASTLLKCVKLRDKAGAVREFGRWVSATVGGKRQKLAGLIARRAAEAELYGRDL